MRLTLRTMLAYLDGILEPEDAQDIGKKIEESEYATKLMHRTRDVMRRLRLAAPSLTDRGPGLDPNTVAEYLDNTLSDDRLPDFEKVCLESDMYLAEVACCHQILTLVLGEPAEIDPASRQRMYQVPQMQAAQAPAESPAAPIVAVPSRGMSAGEGVTQKPRPKLVVPDYLRDPRRRYRWALPAAAALLLAGCFALLVLVALGQFEAGTVLGKLLGIGPGETELAGGPAAAASKPKRSAAAADKAVATSPPPASASSPSPTTQPEKPAPPQPPQPGPASVPEKPPAEPPSEAAPQPPVEPGADLPARPAPQPPSKPGAPAAAEPEVKPPVEAAAEPPQEPSQPMGRLMFDRQVLLKYNAAGANWQRVRGKGILLPQNRLLALPTYRPVVTLSAGITLQLLGGTEIELFRSDQEQPAGVKIAFGRVVIMPLADPGTRLRLLIGECKAVLTFAQAESVAALEVAPERIPGTDPQTGPIRLRTDLYATTGEILWEEGGNRPAVRVTAPARLPVGDPSTQAPIAGGEFPKWIASETIGLLDGRASAAVEIALQADRPADLVLMELDDHRQKEVRWLAARCEAYLGRFDSMVAVLNQPDAKGEWLEYIDILRGALARGPQAAAAIHKALEKQYPQQEAADLYRMLWGYSDRDLQEGADAKLVRFLDHETLAVRLLSFWNLGKITNLGLFYSPEMTAAKRQQPIRRWKERLEKKEIRLRPADAAGTKPSGGGESTPGGLEGSL